jgi:hypothetical protein
VLYLVVVKSFGALPMEFSGQGRMVVLMVAPLVINTMLHLRHQWRRHYEASLRLFRPLIIHHHPFWFHSYYDYSFNGG